MKINQIPPQEHNFTKVLETLVLKPNMLYFYGKMPENMALSEMRSTRPKCLAIVGARKNTSYGEEIAYKLAYDAAKAGAVVISGLAYGIDSIAHRAALDAGGCTVAVLGTPIDEIYPRVHVGLANQIVENGGAVLSEYGPNAIARGAQEVKTRFLARNRLIAGLADVVVVVEAAERSGSLNTASHALEQGKDIFAVPGDITRLSSKGCNKLIAAGANIYTEPQDVLRLLFPDSSKKKPRQMPLTSTDPKEQAILHCLEKGMKDGDSIIEATNLSASEFSQIITMLEIGGLVRALGMNRWTLK